MVTQVGNTVADNPASAEAMTRALLGIQEEDRLTTALFTANASVAENEINIAIQQGQVKPGVDAAAIGLHLQSRVCLKPSPILRDHFDLVRSAPEDLVA